MDNASLKNDNPNSLWLNDVGKDDNYKSIELTKT